MEHLIDIKSISKEEILNIINLAKEFKNGTKTMFKEFFKKETNKKQRANMWTFARFVIPVITLITSIIAISTASIPLCAVTTS